MMKLKNWMLRKVNGLPAQGPRVEPHSQASAPRGAGPPVAGPSEPSLRAFGAQRGGVPDNAEYLGPYRPLIGAIREELEHFVTTQLRLHLAIAERDRYVLSSIEIECEQGDEHRELLRKFIGEFKPEQIKHYLAKEVIAGLRNASAIDLSQFAGLNAAQRPENSSEEAERYGELLAELRRGSPETVAHPYRVTLLGRWTQLDSASPARDPRAPGPRSPQTPLAAQGVAIEIEDADGIRRIELASVVPGRRYSVGKGEGCDIAVDGIYASRRHCEIWFDQGSWWAADAGSTNGIRTESTKGAVARSQQPSHGAASASPIELSPGTWLVLSAHTHGEPKQYPRLSLHPIDRTGAGTKLSTAATGLSPPTPVTPIAPPRPRDGALTITARMESGVRTVEIPPGKLPFRVGRSRSQALVIDWAHADVSGRHFEIISIDESGARIVVQGDNGVSVNGTSYGPGAEFKWKPGETLLLGGGAEQASACTLTLTRAA